MLTTLPPSCAVVTKSGNLNFLEPSGPLQACNGNALPLPLYNFLSVRRRHNCSLSASFANCGMTLYLLKVNLQTFLSKPVTQKCHIFRCYTLVANKQYVQYFAFVARRDQLMGPGESKSLENICGSDTNSVFFWGGIPEHHVVPFNLLEPELFFQF